ncbi:MAG: Rieske (2Fe-2S) protein, partial [Betaproteobacteria bacterium]
MFDPIRPPNATPPEARKATSRNAAQWEATPTLPGTHYVDTRVYTDAGIFEEEIEKIWKKVWLPICHESELAEPLDYRTSAIAGGTPIVIVRGSDHRIRAFFNICAHRGNMIVRSPAGNLGKAEPSGNPKHMTCMYHGFQFDYRGRCVEIPREKAGYQDRLCKADLGLREIKTEVAYGGIVWLNLDDDCEPLADFVAGAFDFMKQELDTEPLDIFHYQKSMFRINYKQWH